jgi:hypothetical protein
MYRHLRLIHGKGINLKYLKSGKHLIHSIRHQTYKTHKPITGRGVAVMANYEQFKPIEKSFAKLSIVPKASKKLMKPLKFKY